MREVTKTFGDGPFVHLVHWTVNQAGNHFDLFHVEGDDWAREKKRREVKESTCGLRILH